MNGREITSIAFTFVVGFFFGVSLYFSGFMQEHDAPKVQTQEDINSFAIVGEVYGGCRSTCPSFHVDAKGDFRYLFTPGINEKQIIREGTLPRSLRQDIANYVTAPALVLQSEKITPSICNSYTDGIDVKYRITLSGTTYILDTCGTAIDLDSELWITLVKIWSYFETGGV